MIGNDTTLNTDIPLKGLSSTDPAYLTQVMQGNQELAIRQKALQLEAQGIPSQIALRQAEALSANTNAQTNLMKLNWYKSASGLKPADSMDGGQNYTNSNLSDLQSSLPTFTQNPTPDTLFGNAPTPNFNSFPDNTNGVTQ